MSETSRRAIESNLEEQPNYVKAIDDPVGRLLTVKEVCNEIGLSRAMIYRIIASPSNSFPRSIKIGNALRWSIVEIIEWKIKALSERD